MRHAWLSLGLICAAIVIIAVGIYRESCANLAQALKDFHAALPPGAEVTYRKANPNILARGATLHDVNFHYKDTRFHARSIRLGSPKSHSGGKLSLSSLVFKEPSYITPKVQLHMSRLVFRHLLIPSSNTQLKNTDITAASMQSLAQLTQFRPDDLTSLRFEWVRAEAFHLTILPAARASYGLLHNGLGLHQMDADNLALEGYSLGGNVGASAVNLHINFSLKPTILASISPVILPEAFFPVARSHATMHYDLNLAGISAHEGVTHLLEHPFKTNAKNAALFWKDPLNTLWKATGTVTLNHLVLNRVVRPEDQLNGPKHPVIYAQAGLDNLIITRRDEGGTGGLGSAFTTILNTEAMLQGFHLRLKDKPLSYPLSGAETILRLSERSHKEAEQWTSDISGQLAVPSIGLIKIASHANMPDELHDDVLAQITLNSTTLGFQGDNFVPMAMALLPKQPALSKITAPAAPKAADKPSDKANNKNDKDQQSSKVQDNQKGVLNSKDHVASDMQEQQHDKAQVTAQSSTQPVQNEQEQYFTNQRDAVVQQLNILTATRPVLAPLSDYILNPKNRTLNVTFGHFSLKTLKNIPFSGPMNAFFDSLHITSLMVQ